MRQRLALLAAFAFGAFVVYAIMSPRNEEWGVVVAQFGEGAGLWGLFASKEDCLKARTGFIEEYGRAAKTVGPVKRGPRSVVIEAGDASVLVTFSCLPLSEIRGLPWSGASHRRSN